MACKFWSVLRGCAPGSSNTSPISFRRNFSTSRNGTRSYWTSSQSRILVMTSLHLSASGVNHFDRSFSTIIMVTPSCSSMSLLHHATSGVTRTRNIFFWWHECVLNVEAGSRAVEHFRNRRCTRFPLILLLRRPRATAELWMPT
jgi:hypothetical protein